MPLLEAQPIKGPCRQVDGEGIRTTTRCVTLLEADYQAIVIELKTACLAAGGTAEQCQTKQQKEDQK